MKRLVVGFVALGALALPMGMAGPAHADHNLCHNEPSDLIVADLDTPGEAYFCVGNVLVVVRVGGPVTVCTNYSNDQDPSNDVCPITQ